MIIGISIIVNNLFSLELIIDKKIVSKMTPNCFFIFRLSNQIIVVINL